MTTILLVEDEPAIADNLIYALRTEGFEPEWFQLGGPAVERARRADVGLVILDVGLPDGSGFEFCKQIRSFSDVPVIFLTARSDEIDRVVGLEIGGDDYVTKPFSPRELTARIKVILRRGRRDPEPGKAGGAEADFTHDRARMAVQFAGEPLSLTRSEYRLLCLLFDHPGRVFSRDRILQQLSDEPGMSGERTVDTHIKEIRGKLRRIRAEPDPIRTHRGLGYSLEGSVREL
ncbi:transcriptional regulator [Acidobacteria bacterium Mor1]|nr:transcriptional regulator [Acidobacteria bacterium Mor1]